MITRTVPVIDGVDRHRFETEIRLSEQPVVMRGLVKDWPSVRAGETSFGAAAAYFKRLDKGQPTPVSILDADKKGRFFYNEDLTGVNFRNDKAPASFVLDWLLRSRDDPAAPTVYVQSLVLDEVMPGFSVENPMPLLTQSYGPRLWLGGEVRTQTHFDPSYNIACLVAGQRRFTLFPPDQIANLYPAPFETAPGGVPVSMASIEEPDFAAHPQFAEALKVAQYADLEPGDALYIPYGWWHHVQSRGPFNLLVNYWWNEGNAAAPKPGPSFLLALATIRDLPPVPKAIWKRIFDLYVFGDTEAATAHVPEAGRASFGDMTPDTMSRIYAYVKRHLGL